MGPRHDYYPVALLDKIYQRKVERYKRNLKTHIIITRGFSPRFDETKIIKKSLIFLKSKNFNA
jgi:hypothetical protein